MLDTNTIRVKIEAILFNNESGKLSMSDTVRRPLLYILMIILGIFSGFTDIIFFQKLGLFVADVFIRMFKCISLPIIFMSIIVTLSSYRSDGVMRRFWQRTMCYTLGTTLVAAGISCLLYRLIKPSMVGGGGVGVCSSSFPPPLPLSIVIY